MVASVGKLHYSIALLLLRVVVLRSTVMVKHRRGRRSGWTGHRHHRMWSVDLLMLLLRCHRNMELRSDDMFSLCFH